MDDLHHLYLVKLVLADDTTSISAPTTSLRAKARRMSGKFQRQTIAGDNFISEHPREGNFRGGNQIKLVVAFILFDLIRVVTRSEERRVGKECRSRSAA